MSAVSWKLRAQVCHWELQYLLDCGKQESQPEVETMLISFIDINNAIRPELISEGQALHVWSISKSFCYTERVKCDALLWKGSVVEEGGRILPLGLWSFKMLLIMLTTLFTRCLLSANMPCAQHIIVDGPTMLAFSKWSLWEQALHTSPLTAPEHNSPKMQFNCI